MLWRCGYSDIFRKLVSQLHACRLPTISAALRRGPVRLERMDSWEEDHGKAVPLPVRQSRRIAGPDGSGGGSGGSRPGSGEARKHDPEPLPLARLQVRSLCRSHDMNCFCFSGLVSCQLAVARGTVQQAVPPCTGASPELLVVQLAACWLSGRGSESLDASS